MKARRSAEKAAMGDGVSFAAASALGELAGVIAVYRTAHNKGYSDALEALGEE